MCDFQTISNLDKLNMELDAYLLMESSLGEKIKSCEKFEFYELAIKKLYTKARILEIQDSISRLKRDN